MILSFKEIIWVFNDFTSSFNFSFLNDNWDISNWDRGFLDWGFDVVSDVLVWDELLLFLFDWDWIVDLELSENISHVINGEELFMISYDVCKNFRLSFKNNRIHIILDFVNLDKHFVIYLVELLSLLVDKYVS